MYFPDYFCTGWLSSLHVSKYSSGSKWIWELRTDVRKYLSLGFQLFTSKTLVLLYSGSIFQQKNCQIRYCLFVWNMRINSNARPLAISRIWLFCLFYDNWLHVKNFLQKTLKHLSSSEVTYMLDLDHIHSVSRISVFFLALVHIRP